MLSSVILAAPALLMLVVKMAVVTSVARGASRFAEDRLASWLMAWVIVHAAMIGIMLCLSAVHALSQAAVWAVALSSASISIARLGIRQPIPALRIGSVLFAALAVFMLFRAAFFQEFTLDAQTYGLSRLGLWMNYQTILVHMPTEQVNIFSNEWNGELNALLYGLAAGNIQGFMFGNVEVLLVVFLSVVWLARLLGASEGWSCLVALALATSPACLGLAGTFKGDLLAVAAVVMAAGWAVTFVRSPRPVFLALAIGCCSLAVGAKITAVFPCLAIALVVGWEALRRLKLRPLTLGIAMGAVLSLPLVSRYLANAVVYGTPLKRTSNETMAAGISTFLDSAGFIGRMLLRTGPDSGQAYGWLIAGGLGASGFLCVGILLYQAWRGPRLDGVRTVLAVAAVLSLAVAAFVVPSQPWAFRYFLPAVMLAAVAFLSVRVKSSITAVLLSAAAVGVFLANVENLLRPGEINGNSTFTDTLGRSARSTLVDRTFLNYPPLRQDFGFDLIEIDQGRQMNVAVHAYLNRPSAPLIGSRAQNRLTYFETEGGLLASLGHQCFDLVALTKLKPVPLNRDAVRELTSAGYQVITDGELLSLARNSAGCP